MTVPGATRGTNLFSTAGSPLSQEAVELLASSGQVRIERIVSRGHVSPPDFWYDQVENEWVAVLAGSARLRLRTPDEVVALRAGDHILIVAHRLHRVEWTPPDEDTVWLTVFYPGSEGT